MSSQLRHKIHTPFDDREELALNPISYWRRQFEEGEWTQVGPYTWRKEILHCSARIELDPVSSSSRIEVFRDYPISSAKFSVDIGGALPGSIEHTVRGDLASLAGLQGFIHELPAQLLLKIVLRMVGLYGANRVEILGAGTPLDTERCEAWFVKDKATAVGDLWLFVSSSRFVESRNPPGDSPVLKWTSPEYCVVKSDGAASFRVLGSSKIDPAEYKLWGARYSTREILAAVSVLLTSAEVANNYLQSPSRLRSLFIEEGDANWPRRSRSVDS